ncbi:RHS repeat-associated core domain-containing protein, partial [Variovorax sp. ZT4R33]|uniref:RHS repeat-associated core domain-containing protein n=1 Tax=Variovorax sp. ZT4R33 TaxID=3443743 RepID=UPI003F476757
RQAEALGYVFAYDEQGSLIGEYGLGGAHSAGTKQYVYLPTAAGPMPIVVMADDTRYAITADHLNTPRRATWPDGDLRWQWGYSAFGDEQPTVADRRFNKTTPLESDFGINLRYPGQYFDAESNLHYNGFRTYNPNVGRYTQGDPIGLDGGWNRFGYVDSNPLSYVDPEGLLLMSTVGGLQRATTLGQAATYGAPGNAAAAAGLVGAVGGAATAGVGGAYLRCVPSPARTGIGLLKGLRDDAMPPPTPPQPPVLLPPAIVRPGGFNPPAPPPGISARP